MNNVMDTEQDFEEFAKKYPDLMAKSRQDYIGVGNGWFGILDVLFGLLSSKVNQARYQLKYALEHPENKYSKPIAELETALATALEELPAIEQIKEKFGSLRFYVNNASEEHYAYIAFAGAMSNRTCEICGDVGEVRHGDWIKVLCDKHHAERQRDIEEYRKPRVSSTKLSDE